MYIIQTSTNLLDPTLSGSVFIYPDTYPASNLFNYNSASLPWRINSAYDKNYNATTPFRFPVSTDVSSGVLSTIITTNLTIYGHSILLYYSEKFIIS